MRGKALLVVALLLAVMISGCSLPEGAEESTAAAGPTGGSREEKPEGEKDRKEEKETGGEVEVNKDESLYSEAGSVLLREEIKELIYRANEEAFSMGVKGFEEEFLGEPKTPFSHYKPLLLSWYCESIVANLELFYENHLGEWGYEMGFAFPLHTRALAEEGFQYLKQEGEGLIVVNFHGQAGHEEWKCLTYTLKKQEDGFWIITRLGQEALNP